MIKFNASLLNIISILSETEKVIETIRINTERIMVILLDKFGNVA